MRRGLRAFRAPRCCAWTTSGHTFTEPPGGPPLTRFIAAAGLLALCGACDKAAARKLTDHGISPVDVFVRAGNADDGQARAGQLLAAPAAVPDGSEARPFTSLGAALEAAPSGALLRMGEGVFRERLIIRRPVVFLGRGAGRTRIVAPDSRGA